MATNFCKALCLGLLLASPINAAPQVGVASPAVRSVSELNAKHLGVNELFSWSKENQSVTTITQSSISARSLSQISGRSLLNDPTGTSISVRSKDTDLASPLDRRFIWTLLVWGQAHIVAAVIATAALTVGAICGTGIALISKGFTLAGALTCGITAVFGLMAASFAIFAGVQTILAGITTAALTAGAVVSTRDETAAEARFLMHHPETGELFNHTHIFNATRENPLVFTTGGSIGRNMSRPVTYWRGINPSTNKTGNFLKMSSPSFQMTPPAGVKSLKERDSYAHDWFYGFDDYGGNYDTDFENALGGAAGFDHMVQGVADIIVDNQSWETCVCTQVGSTWKTTGSIQGSWDDTYNGYAPCWNANCDGS